MSKEFEQEAKCCLNPNNLQETMRTKESRGVFVWFKCKVCDQYFLVNAPEKDCKQGYESKEKRKTLS